MCEGAKGAMCCPPTSRPHIRGAPSATSGGNAGRFATALGRVKGQKLQAWERTTRQSHVPLRGAQAHLRLCCCFVSCRLCRDPLKRQTTEGVLKCAVLLRQRMSLHGRASCTFSRQRFQKVHAEIVLQVFSVPLAPFPPFAPMFPNFLIHAKI